MSEGVSRNPIIGIACYQTKTIPLKTIVAFGHSIVHKVESKFRGSRLG